MSYKFNKRSFQFLFLSGLFTLLSALFWFQNSPKTFRDFDYICKIASTTEFELNRCMSPYYGQTQYVNNLMYIFGGLAVFTLVLFVFNLFSGFKKVK